MLRSLQENEILTDESRALEVLFQSSGEGAQIGTTLRTMTFSAIGTAVAPAIAAAIGASAGSVVPVIGTAIGAALGYAYSALFGKRDDFERLSWEEQNNVSSPLAFNLVKAFRQTMTDNQLGQLVQLIRVRARNYLLQYTQDLHAELEYSRIIEQEVAAQAQITDDLPTRNQAELQFVLSIFFHGILTSLDRGDVRLGQDKIRITAGLGFISSLVREVTGSTSRSNGNLPKNKEQIIGLPLIIGSLIVFALSPNFIKSSS